MSVFKDSGHHWWRQCERCEMAKFVGNKPACPDGAWECDHCRKVSAPAQEARAEGYAAAREQAAKMFDADAGSNRGTMAERMATRSAERIRAMQDEGGES
jgi:hypothetical protein